MHTLRYHGRYRAFETMTVDCSEIDISLHFLLIHAVSPSDGLVSLHGRRKATSGVTLNGVL
jgi:hypothetical protein